MECGNAVMHALQVSKSDLKKLFVHSIPSAAQPADLLHLFEACTCACPTVEGNMKDRRGMLCKVHMSGTVREHRAQLGCALRQVLSQHIMLQRLLIFPWHSCHPYAAF